MGNVTLTGKNAKQDKPEFTEAQYEYLQKLFGTSYVAPDVPPNQVYYEAGQRSVVEHISKQVRVWKRRSVS